MEVTRLKDYVVLAEDLTKRFKNSTAVNGLNLKIKKGEIFALLGSDGAGKTTTIQMLCGILAPTSGLMFVGGHNVEEEPDAIRSQIGYMSQDFTLYLDMTVEENIDFVADLRGVSETEKKKQKERLLRFSRMEPFRNRRAAALSGGMKKKLALSCALIHHPTVLILDEPTTAVDPLSRSELWKILYEFIMQGITVILSTPQHSILDSKNLKFIEQVVETINKKISDIISPNKDEYKFVIFSVWDFYKSDLPKFRILSQTNNLKIGFLSP